MRFGLVAIGLLVASSAFAQPAPTLEEMTQAYLRETGQDRLVIANLQKQIDDLKKELAAKAVPAAPEAKKSQ